MTHETALNSKAAQRYVLGELSWDERELFEEHFFTCAECSEEVRATAAFADNTAAVFADEALAAVVHPHTHRVERRHARWFNWFSQPAFVLPLAACALVTIMAVGQFMQLRDARRQIAALTQPQQLRSTMIRPLARGQSPAITIPLGANFFEIRIDAPPELPGPVYEYDMERADGVRVAGGAWSKDSDDTLSLLLPASGFPPGAYTLHLRAAGSTERASTYHFVTQLGETNDAN